MVKDLPANAGDTGGTNSILDWKVSLEEEISTHSSILAWEMPRTEEPGQLQYMGLQTVRHDQVTEHTHTRLRAHTHTHTWRFITKYRRDWWQEEKGTMEEEMAGWNHRLDGLEFE